jgi:hypothetical protein
MKLVEQKAKNENCPARLSTHQYTMQMSATRMGPSPITDKYTKNFSMKLGRVPLSSCNTSNMPISIRPPNVATRLSYRIEGMGGESSMYGT